MTDLAPELLAYVRQTCEAVRDGTAEEKQYVIDKLGVEELGADAEALARRLLFPPPVPPWNRLAHRQPVVIEAKPVEDFSRVETQSKRADEPAPQRAIEQQIPNNRLEVPAPEPAPVVLQRGLPALYVPKPLALQSSGLEKFEIEGRGHNYNRPAKTYGNAELAIRKIGFICSYNDFLGRYVFMAAEGHLELSDDIVAMVRKRVHETFEFDPSKDHIRDAMKGLCLFNRFNPVVDWLNGLEWDGTARLDDWLAQYLGANPSELNAAIGRKALCAMIRRAKQPGCKFDHVPVLEGLEGIGKSAVVRVLASGPGEGYFSDATILDVNDRQQQELTKGIWAYELGELTGIKKADIDKVKQFVTRTNDRGREAYGHFVKDQPRQCVFWGTTNDHEYLGSQTGNRRWWPIACTTIDVDGLRDVRDQLFAEAVVLEAAGEELFLPAELIPSALELQESRRIKHAWEDLLTGIETSGWGLYVVKAQTENGPEWRVHTRDIYEYILKIPAVQRFDAHNKTLSGIMQRLGWLKSPNTIRIRNRGSAPGYSKPCG